MLTRNASGECVDVISVLNPAGPKSADDRKFMVCDWLHKEPIPAFGVFNTREEANAEAAEINRMPDSHIRQFLMDWANE